MVKAFIGSGKRLWVHVGRYLAHATGNESRAAVKENAVDYPAGIAKHQR